MADGTHGGKRHGKGGFGSRKVGKDGLTGPERARIAGTKGAINHAVKVLGHDRKEYDKIWERVSSIKSEH